MQVEADTKKGIIMKIEVGGQYFGRYVVCAYIGSKVDCPVCGKPIFKGAYTKRGIPKLVRFAWNEDGTDHRSCRLDDNQAIETGGLAELYDFSLWGVDVQIGCRYKLHGFGDKNMARHECTIVERTNDGLFVDEEGFHYYQGGMCTYGLRSNDIMEVIA